ncbi:hypothetical protein PLESTM_002039100 [Pleodorina starrii]|nr:hypothetical protein PLESTM_002039100 [Pleodorina starrii]
MQSLLGGIGRRRTWKEDATMDVESLGDVSVSSSIERQAMREQLDTVRQTLNSLANATQPNASGVNAAAPAGIDSVLTEIASKLSNIEGLYTNLTTKLEKVDLRVEDSERHIKDLQHFSASTIHETARLVDYVGNRATPGGTRTGSQAGTAPSGISAGPAMRGRNLAASGVPSTPPPPGMSPSRSSVQALDYASGHANATIQQHAAQIHKLIAGLDFLEAHIIRQDQVVEGLQKQMLSVARDVASASAVAESRTSPSELSLRIHDMGELLNKLRAHMYKVEKKTSNNDQALMLLTQRIQAVEGGRHQQQNRQAGGDSLSSEQEGTPSPSVLELAAGQEELRSMVQDLCRDVLELRDQLQAQAATQAPQSTTAPGLSAEEGAEMRRQLSYLMAQVPTLLVENKELKDVNTTAQKRIDDLASALGQQKRQLQEQQQAGPAAPPTGGSVSGSSDEAAAAAELRATVASLQGQVAALEGRLQGAAARADPEALSSAVKAVERQAAASIGELAAVRESVAAVQARVVVLQDCLNERKAESLSAAVQTSSMELQTHSSGAQPLDAVAKLFRPISAGTPEAALLAGQVAAAARADLEEQLGQLRHKVAVATAAAEEAARCSAESATAAAAALEAASKNDGGSASLQETVLAMVAGVEQEQAGLKQQLAQLAAQVSEEQSAISAGLLQLQEQVSTAASAAIEATAAAQAMQAQQAAASSQQHDQEQLKAELREQVASVMERIKERVGQGMQQVDAQLSAFSDRLAGAVTPEQLEAALERLHSAAADLSERHELAAASLQELRAELILLTGEQDVMQSRMRGLESVIGVNAQLGRSAVSSSLPPGIEEGQEEGNAANRPGGEQQPGAEEGCVDISGGGLSLPAAVSPGSRGLLDLVAELQSRVGGLECALETAAADMDRLLDLMQSNGEQTKETIQQATAQLISDLKGLSTVVDKSAADLLAMEATSAAMQQKVADQAGVTSELGARMEEVQLRLESEVIARVQETAAAVSSLSARIAREYINREQLGAIFQARADMKRAVDELATVFNTGRLMRTTSTEDGAAAVAAEPEGSSPASTRKELSPELIRALENLAGKQAELEHQVALALYRSEGAVRQEQLMGVQQAMMTLELQFRRLNGGAAAATGQQTATAAEDLSDLRTRVEALEAALSASSGIAASAAAVEATPRASTSSLRVLLTPEDPAASCSPVRLSLSLVACEGEEQQQPFPDSAAPLLEVGGPDDLGTGAEEQAGEPSLSSMLQAAAASSPPEAHGLDLSESVDEQLQLQELQRAVTSLTAQAEALRSEVVVEATERQRLAEALSELTERLDLQVNATASTAAMVATMATDAPSTRVALQLRVGATDAEADLATLATTVSTLAARLDAAEESLAAAFVVRSPTRAVATAVTEGVADGTSTSDAAPLAGARGSEEAAAASGSSEDGSEDSAAMRPALGLMVPILPRQVEAQIAALQADAAKLEVALGSLAGRVSNLEAADALEEVRAAASEAVLEAIPGLVSQRVSVVREEIEALVSRQGEQLLEMAGQAARDAGEAVLAVREAAAEAREAAEVAANEAVMQAAAAREAAAEAEAAAAAAAATASAREAALEVAMSVAREVAEETVRGATAAHDGPATRDEEAASRVSRLAAEVQEVSGAVGSLIDRMNDVDSLRDQLEALAVQVRDSIATSAVAIANDEDLAATSNDAESAQGQPSTPTAAAVASIFTPAATALVIPPPAHTPRGASPSPGGSRQAGASQAAAASSQQATFLARLVAVVKRQSSRLHAQYSDAEETGMALAQVDSTLEEAEARLADVRDANSPAFAETLVTVLEQVAALRYIGSQTHPAVQQMVLEHENRLDKIAEDLKAFGSGSPSHVGAHAVATSAPYPAVTEELGLMSRQVSRLEAELTRVAGQQAALDRAVKDMLAAVGSVRLGSVSGSSIATGITGSRRTSAHDGYAPEALAAADSRVAQPEDAATEEETAAGAEGAIAAAMEDGNVSAASGVASALEVAGLAAQVRLLEDTLEVQLGGLRSDLMAEIRARAGSGGGAAVLTAANTAADLGALEKTVSQLHSAMTAIRNRLLAMQEYVDSTQGMIKDMHVGLGGLHRRVDTLEASSGPGSRSARVSTPGSADSADIKELQSDLVKFERRLLVVESSSVEAAHALAGLKGLAPRVTEAEARLQDACCKLALTLGGSASSVIAPTIPAVAPGGSLPALGGAVRALERRLGGRMEAVCGTLGTLAEALSAAGRIQAESTANPFKAISAAVNNPVMVAMDKKLETVRSEILAAATSILEDMRRDQQQSQLESRLASADTSVRGGGGGGSDYGGGGGGGLTFRV